MTAGGPAEPRTLASAWLPLAAARLGDVGADLVVGELGGLAGVPAAERERLVATVRRFAVDGAVADDRGVAVLPPQHRAEPPASRRRAHRPGPDRPGGRRGPAAGARLRRDISIIERYRRGMSDVVVVGGGPAGVLLTYLLARGGASVTLLESRHDFARRFRGDTLAPGVLEYLDGLGLAEPLLAEVPHTRSDAFRWHTASRTWTLVDYRGASTRFPFYALHPAGRVPAVARRPGPRARGDGAHGGAVLVAAPRRRRARVRRRVHGRRRDAPPRRRAGRRRRRAELQGPGGVRARGHRAGREPRHPLARPAAPRRRPVVLGPRPVRHAHRQPRAARPGRRLAARVDDPRRDARRGPRPRGVRAAGRRRRRPAVARRAPRRPAATSPT